MKPRSNEYLSLHRWLNVTLGKAAICMNGCLGKKKYEWALKQGKNYERNVDNFIPLCTSCHRLYDMTPSKLKRIRRMAVKQRKLTFTDAEDIRLLYTQGIKQTQLAAVYSVDQAAVSLIVNKKTYA